MRRRGLALPGVEELALDDAARDLCVAQLSREVALLCRRDGVVSWADGRADRVLGAVTKLPLSARAVPGTEAKVSGLVARACDGPVEGFELSLLAFGRPATFAFSGVPCADGAMLVGRLLAEDVAKLGEVSAAMAELGELHRETQRQKREISRQNDDLARANRELSDSNRALLTMHAVLDDKNDALRHASDVKTRVVANVSHEFRTPINSILGLSQLLLDRLDGELTAEQEKQVRFVRSSAETLSVLVNDLLDLSRIEAGRHELRATEFDVAELLSSLRGMMKPLVHPEVDLVVDEPAPLPRMHTDAGKLSQILRNLVSNAIKFTTRGVIRVRALPSDDGRVRFEVSDTGIGIASADHDRVFEEFTQIDSPVQSRVQGSGLGLHLSRKFAELLGGSLTLRSELGEGSTFVLEVPVLHEEVATVHTMTEKAAKIDASKRQVLVVEDNRQTLFFYERYLSSAGFQVIPARTVDEARAALARLHPAAIVLDVMLEGEVTWSFLAELKEGDATRDIDLAALAVDADGFVFGAAESYDPPTQPLDADGQGRPYAVYGYGAQIAELEVDVRLGTVRLIKITAAHDVGRAINPLLAEGQIEGGIAQGIGMALMEEYVPGRTENLHDYLIPTIGDVPPIESILVEVTDPEGPFGAKGLGEHVLIPTAPAILNAIRHATGAAPDTVPATPTRVLAAIREARQ